MVMCIWNFVNIIVAMYVPWQLAGGLLTGIYNFSVQDNKQRIGRFWGGENDTWVEKVYACVCVFWYCLCLLFIHFTSVL